MIALRKFNSFSEKYLITYSLYGGTLLGAIRERDMIAWDDDVDVIMTRENFDLLKKFLPSTSEFVLDNNKWVYVLKFADLDVSIDIFILEKFSKNIFIHKIKVLFLRFLQTLIKGFKTNPGHSFMARMIQRLIYFPFFFIGESFLLKLYMRASIALVDNSSSLYFPSNDTFNSVGKVFHAPNVRNTQLKNFGPYLLPCYADYDNILTNLYGNDYMHTKIIFSK